MPYSALKIVHILSIVVWVGGMAFAHFCLRPALAAWPAEQRLRLMHDVLGRFFRVVSLAIVLVLLTGLWMIAQATRPTNGVHIDMPLNWSIMAALGIVMMAIYGHIRYASYKRLGRAVGASDWKTAAAALAGIRRLVAINLTLGVLTVIVAAAGRWG